MEIQSSLLEMNLGIPDRIFRILIGLAMIYVALYMPISVEMIWSLTILGCLIMVTAISSFCPVYKLLKINTCRPL